jgi:mRNA interferase MazF
MERFIKGDIVVVPFPFSDLSDAKKRPALVLADLPGEDIILCQITSQQNKDRHAIALDHTNFLSGSLPTKSFIQPSRIFTDDKNIILSKAGTLKKPVISTTVQHIVEILGS